MMIQYPFRPYPWLFQPASYLAGREIDIRQLCKLPCVPLGDAGNDPKAPLIPNIGEIISAP